MRPNRFLYQQRGSFTLGLVGLTNGSRGILRKLDGELPRTGVYTGIPMLYHGCDELREKAAPVLF